MADLSFLKAISCEVYILTPEVPGEAELSDPLLSVIGEENSKSKRGRPTASLVTVTE